MHVGSHSALPDSGDCWPDCCWEIIFEINEIPYDCIRIYGIPWDPEIGDAGVT